MMQVMAEVLVYLFEPETGFCNAYILLPNAVSEIYSYRGVYAVMVSIFKGRDTCRSVVDVC